MMILSLFLLLLLLLCNNNHNVFSFTIVKYKRYYNCDCDCDWDCEYSSPSALFGIKGFRAWFEHQFPSSISYKEDDLLDRIHQNNEQKSHILIDMNQLLHVALRRSKNEDHALTMVLKELDGTLERLLTVSTENRSENNRIENGRQKNSNRESMNQNHGVQSIVLALDGPPCAAKLVTQRRRRFSTLSRAETKQQRANRLAERGIIFHPSAKAQRGSRRKRERMSEESTLCITPGTEFMKKADQALQFWAWQRLSSQNNPLRKCRIYINSSDVPGEGEVKLLDWVMSSNVKEGDNIIFMGGDSDLVLEGLILPIAITHNVFVVLPEDSNKTAKARKKKSTEKNTKTRINNSKALGTIIDLWKTTLSLTKNLPQLTTISQLMHVRTDLVLLLILNGNDYLPKLRGSSGFQKLFSNYFKVLREWFNDPIIKKDGESSLMDAPEKNKPFFVYWDSDTSSLALNLPFCIVFFRKLALSAPQNLLREKELRVNYTLNRADSITPLSILHTYTDGGFLPKPKFDVLPSSSSVVGYERVRLSMIPKYDSILYNNFDRDLVYEIEHIIGKVTLQAAKQQLAKIALDDLLGDQWASQASELSPESTDDSFPWELNGPAECDVEGYLQGLLWNLQTYQDGVCADYAYNYGRRLAPSASDIADYLDFCCKQSRNEMLSRKQLKGDKFVKPLNSGLSCLAALPSKASYLVPHPYKLLADDGNLIDELYCSCIDEAGALNMEKFRSVCLHEVRKRTRQRYLRKGSDIRTSSSTGSHLYQVKPPSKHWTVYSLQGQPIDRPFDPPKQYCEAVSKLRRNKHIRINLMTSSMKPKFNASKNDISGSLNESNYILEKEALIQDTNMFMETQNNQNNSGKAYEEENRNVEMLIDLKDHLIFSESFIVVDLPLLNLEADGDPSKLLNSSVKATPVAILNELVQVRKIQELEWDGPSLDGWMTLTVKSEPEESSEKTEWSKTYRALKTELLSKRAIKHQLARAVLNDFVGTDWVTMKPKDMKSKLVVVKEQ